VFHAGLIPIILHVHVIHAIEVHLWLLSLFLEGLPRFRVVSEHFIVHHKFIKMVRLLDIILVQVLVILNRVLIIADCLAIVFLLFGSFRALGVLRPVGIGLFAELLGGLLDDKVVLLIVVVILKPCCLLETWCHISPRRLL
jgi:hypothetical protein